MKEYVLGFLFSYNFEQVVLIRKNKPAWQAGKLNGLGGLIEATDPSAVSAMRREFKEECGIDMDDWNQFAIMEGSDWRVYCFVGFRARDWVNSQLRTTTDEPVGAFDNPEVFEDPEGVLNNLGWLCAMAREHTFGRQPILTIFYPQ